MPTRRRSSRFRARSSWSNHIQNAYGRCEATHTCVEACPAPTPAEEVCDGTDDDWYGSAYEDLLGSLFFTGLNAGKNTLRIVATGHADLDVEVNVLAGGSALDVELLMPQQVGDGGRPWTLPGARRLPDPEWQFISCRVAA